MDDLDRPVLDVEKYLTRVHPFGFERSLIHDLFVVRVEQQDLAVVF